MLKVLPCQPQPAGTLATHAVGDTQLAREALANGIAQCFLIIEGVLDNDFAGPLLLGAVIQVIAGQKGTEYGSLIFLPTGYRLVGAMAEHLACAHGQHLDQCQAVTNTDGDHIDIAATGIHILLLLHMTNGSEPVAQLGGLFIIQVCRSLLHVLRQGARHLLVTAFKKRDGKAYLLAIILLADQPDTGRGTPANLVLQARTGAVAKIAVLAVTQQEYLFEQRQGFAHRRAARIRTEITRTGLLLATMKGNTRPGVGGSDTDIGIGLVVAQQDIVRRSVFLDQRLLQQQRFCFAVRDRGFNRGNTRHQCACLRAGDVRRKVAAKARAQVTGLADI